MEKKMKYLSLFSGIGGFECAINQVFIALSGAKKAQCLGFSEIDKMATKVYLEHFPDHPALGDITQVDFRPFRGQVDLVVGGFPCQDLSSIRNLHFKDKDKKDKGLKDGIEGERSGLFFEFLRCLEECQPKFFIMENVASMSKENRKKISELIGVEPVLLNSKDFTAQKRRRLFWFNFNLPPINNNRKNILFLTEFNDILVPVKEARGLAHSEKRVKYFLSPLSGAKNKGKTRLEKYKGFFYDTTKEKTPCLLASAHAVVLDYRFIKKDKEPLFRKLAQVEAERLQGFPDGWTSSLSYTASIKRLGNAVTVPVVEFILSQLYVLVELF